MALGPIQWAMWSEYPLPTPQPPSGIHTVQYSLQILSNQKLLNRKETTKPPVDVVNFSVWGHCWRYQAM